MSAEDGIYNCFSRGTIKMRGEIIPGDLVEFVYERGEHVIESVKERVNSLIRPPVANIDTVLIVISPLPRPDFLLVDKLIINCHREDITPILCYNKSDIADQALIKSVKSSYSKVVDTIFVSAITGEGIADLKVQIQSGFTCFVGQSAVGKSSIINALSGKDMQEVGDLSRIERGRNTTRHVEIFDIGGILIADTCGFSSLENMDMDPTELPLMYDEYMELTVKCRYNGCTHTAEPECAVKQAVENGQLNRDRYERYLEITKEIKEKWSRRYE